MKQKKIDKKILMLIFPLLIFIGKVLRWTVLKSVLVDMSIGNGMISKILYNDLSIELFQASNNASYIFQSINIFGLTTTTQFEIYISVIFNILLFCLLFFDRRKHYTLFHFIFLSVSIIVLNIWNLCLAKEPIQFLFFFVIYLVLISKKLTDNQKWIGACIVIIFIGLFYRIYYFLILLFTIATYFLFNKFIIKIKKISLKNIAFILLFYFVLFLIGINIVRIFSNSTFNEMIAVRLNLASANTEIIPIFNSENLILFSLEYVLVIVRLLFPIELLPMGIKYLPYVLYQIFISYIIIKEIINYRNSENYQKITLIVFVGFLLGSAAFEPDFGSWVRHEAVALPLLLIMSKIKTKVGESL